MSLLPRRTKTDKKVKTPGDGDDHSMHRSYSLNRGLVFVNNQLRTVQRGLEFDFGRTTIGELVDQADGLQFRQYEIRCQLKIHRIEKNIEVLQAFEIVTNLATTIVSAVQLLAPAGPVLASINQLLGYAKSVQLNKREALSVTDKAVSMTLGMQQTIKHVNFKIPPVMITCIHDFYRALDECAVDVCTAAEQSTLPRELLAKIHGESFKAILEDGKEAMEDAYKRFIADCQVIAIAGIYHPNNPATIDEDQQDRKADEEAMCQDLKRLLALGVDGFIDAVKIAGLAPIQREGIKRAIIIAEKLEQAKTQALSTSASTSTPTVTTAAIGASNTTSSMNTPVDPAPVPKPVDLTNSRPPSPQPPVTVFMLLYMVNTPSVTEALALPQTPIPNTRATPDGYSSKPQQSNELVSLRSDFLKRTLEALEAIDADPSPPSPPRRTLMKLTSHEPQTNTFLARVDSSAIPEARWHGKNVRVKSISRVPDDMMGSPKRRRRWRQAYLDQVNLWRNLKPSPFVLHLLGASFVDSSRPWHFLSPFMSNGDIVSYLASPAGAAADRLSLVWQMAQGLRHLHAQQIVHGDFRPKNVLINDQGQAVLSEFGFFFDMKLQVAYDFRGQPETALLSPELLHAIDMREGAIVRFGDVTMASDVFAFGKTSLYVLGNIMPMTFTPKLPFDLDLRREYQFLRFLWHRSRGIDLSQIVDLLQTVLTRLFCTYRNHPVKRPTMARLCNMLEKQRFTSEKLRPELDFTSLEICIWGYNMWIDATKAASHPSPFESLSLPSQPPPRPAREDSVETDQYTDASQEIYDVLDISMVPDQLQDIVLSSSFNQGAVFPLVQATLGLYTRLQKVGWQTSTEDPAVETCVRRAMKRLLDNVAILQAIGYASGAMTVLDCEVIRDIMFAARVLTLRASMQFGPGGACPYPWTDEVRDIFRLEVQDIVKETFNGADILNRQLQRLIDDERLLLDNMYVGILPVDHPYLEVSGDGVYGYPGPKGVLKPLLNRLVGFPWWSIDGLHDLAEWESELDPSNALTKEAASLERTLEVAEIEDALELALSEEISEGLRVKEAEIKGKVKVLEGMIREIAGVPMSLHVDETYDHTEIPPKFPESIRSPELWAEPQESTWGKSTTMQDRVEHQGKDTKIRTAGKKGIKGVVLPGPPPKFRSNRGGGGGGKHLGARGGEKRRFIPKQGSDAVSKLSSETAKKDGVDWEDHLEERDSSLVDVI